MTRSQLQLLPVVVLVIAVGFGSPAKAQFPSTIMLDVLQLGQPAAAPTYQLRIFPFSSIGTDVTLTAPGGRTFSSRRLQPISAASYAEFSQEYFGEWTILEDSFVSSASDSIYKFTFSAFTLADVVSEVPAITEPADGATVPPTFSLTWQFPSGAMPTRTIQFSPGRVAETTFDPAGAQRVQFDVDPAKLGASPLTLRAGTSQSIAAYLGPVTLVSGPARTSYSLSSLHYYNLSPPATVHVIPEPTALALLTFTALLLAAHRRNLVLRDSAA